MSHAIDYQSIFSKDRLELLFPSNRSNQFFEALLGDAQEGAYDICLYFKTHESDRLIFEFHLNQRPNKCLVCSLTYGLPHVFSKHPIINVKGLIQDINQLLSGKVVCEKWQLGRTFELSPVCHIIPLIIEIREL